MKVRRMIMLVGLPGSGKDTFINNYIRKVWPGVVVLDKDNIRQMIYGRYDYSLEDEGFVNKMFEGAFAAAYKDGRDIVINDPNLTTTARLEVVDFVRRLSKLEHGAYVEWWVYEMDTPVEVCVDRRRSDGRGLPAERWRRVIEGMSKVHKRYDHRNERIASYYAVVKDRVVNTMFDGRINSDYIKHREVVVKNCIHPDFCPPEGVCSKCGQSMFYGKEENLKLHKPGDTITSCPHCNKSFVE